MMKRSISAARRNLYLWTGFAYFLLWCIIDMSYFPDAFPVNVLNNSWRAVYIIPINFILFEYTLPYALKRKNVLVRIFLALMLIWTQMMLYAFGLYAWRYLGIRLHVYTDLVPFDEVLTGVTYVVPYGAFSLFFFGIITHIYDHIKLKETTQQLKIEKQQAELNYLKSQTNPHFLFNTLNNIYALARDKSDLTPESILRLSKILRFMLYETGGAYISIGQELKIIDDYIGLEALRYDDSLRVNFTYDIEDPNQAVPPLLLIPLVENAFKHGASEARTRPFVDIHVAVKSQQLTLVVKNSSEKVAEEPKERESIGLSNLKRQLQLLYSEYELTVQQSETVFTATLKINLASHV